MFRGGRLATQRRCETGYGGTPGICRINVVRGGVFVSFWFDRRVDPPTEEAVGRVLALLDAFVVEGPKLTDGPNGR